MSVSKLISLLTIPLSLVCCVAIAAPNTPEIEKLNQTAEQYLTAKDYQHALEALNQALTLDPNNIDALHKRVVTYMLLNETEKARPDLDKLIQLATTPAQKYALTAYKDSYYKQFNEAKTELDNAIKLDPTSPDLYADRADVYRNLKNYDLALQDANMALKLDPNFFGAYYARARIYKDQGNTDAAKQDFVTADKLKKQQYGS